MLLHTDIASLQQVCSMSLPVTVASARRLGCNGHALLLCCNGHAVALVYVEADNCGVK